MKKKLGREESKAMMKHQGSEISMAEEKMSVAKYRKSGGENSISVKES